MRSTNTRHSCKLRRCVLLLSLFVLSFCSTCLSQAQSSPPRKSESVDLALKQSQLADRYRQLESMLLKMAEYDASNNPRRSALLRQALSKGKERQIGGQMDLLVKAFQREQLQKAVDGQSNVQTDLKVLLDLLLSENRPDRLKNEQARVRDYIKQLDRIIRQQKSVQGRTESGESTDRLAKDQQRIAKNTEKLGEAIDESEGLKPSDEGSESKEGDAEQKAGESQEGDSKKGEGEQSGESNPEQSEGKEGGESGESNGKSGKEGGEDKEGEAGEKSDSEESDSDNSERSDQDSAKSEESKPSEGSESSEGESKSDSKQGKSGEQQQGQKGQESQQGQEGQQGQDGQQGQEGQQGQQSQQQKQQSQEQQFPGRKRIAAAEDRMRQAQEKLKQAERDEAVEEQEHAKRLLEQARAELEEILRQLREEEIERVLAMLEGRFRKMLEMELKIQDTTVRLNKTPAAKRTRQFTIQAGKLSLNQRKVILEVDKALTLLKEEGSSVAFPEAAQQMRDDMQIVARRISEEKVGSLTQAVEADIIIALEEMIAALQKAQQEAEERRQQQQQQQGKPQQMDPSNQPLVNKIAELKMIRALQMRVNTRTQRYSKMLVDVEDPVGQATDDDILDSLRGLSERQKRIHKITSDIVLGKNQ